MSNLVLPTQLAGFAMKLEREPEYTVKISETLSGKELRSTWATYPRTRYRLAFDVLRSDSTYTGRVREWQQLFGHLARSFGQLDSFLVTDPDDSSVTDMGFAAGDGATTAFQLQRSLGGAYTSVLGTFTPTGKPRTNLCTYSQDFTQAAWSKVASGVALSPLVTGAFGAAPDGTNTASFVSLNLNGGSTSSDYSRLYQQITGLAIGSNYTQSIWARTSDGTTVVVQMRDDISNASQLITVTPAWQRFTLPFTTPSNFTSTNLGLWLRGVNGTASTANLLLWGAQLEVGQTATDYIATTSVAVTSTPKYWPAWQDGYEPIYDLNGAPTIYLAGDWRGRRALYPWTRTNLCPYSEQVDQWTNAGTFVYANRLVAPDGNTTAEQVCDCPAPTVTGVVLTPSTTGGTLAAATYYVRISSLTAAGEGLASVESSATTTGATGSIAISWSANTLTPATGYRVYIGTSPGAETSFFAPGNVTSWTYTGQALTAGSPATFSATQKYVYRNLVSSEVAGQVLCISAYLKAGSGLYARLTDGSSNEGINCNLLAGTVDGQFSGTGNAPLASGVQNVGSGWYRFWFVKQVKSGALGVGPLVQLCADNTYTAAAYTADGTCHTYGVWGAQAEVVASPSAGPSSYLPTPSSVTVSATDYTLSASGVVTLASAPSAGTYLSWDGSYYRRVRFEQPSLTAERLAQYAWAAGSVPLILVKP